MAPEGSVATAEEETEAEIYATWYIAELEAEIEGLRAQIRRLKGNQSFGYVRGRGMTLPTSGSIVPAKPRIEPLDVLETQAPHG